jgi:hypothetical protein
MVQVCIKGAPGSGVQVAGRTYAAGEIVVLPIPVAAGLVADGRAYVVADAPEVRVPVGAAEHRDPTLKVGRGRV